MLTDINAEKLGSYIAYIGAIIYAIVKVFQYFYKYVKEILPTKKDKKDDGIVVNVSNGLPILPKSSSEDFRYFLYLLLEQNKILRASHDIKSDTLKEQMEFYKKHSKNIKMFAIELMIKLLDDAGIDDTGFGTYFSNFENFIDVCESRCEATFKEMCIDNHFSERNNQEFRELIIKNIVIMEGTINDLLRRRYPQREFIKNFNSIYTLCDIVRRSLEDCFEFARDISMEKEEKVRCAKNAFEKQISEIIGIKYSVDI
jgi:hypothetical protein